MINAMTATQPDLDPRCPGAAEIHLRLMATSDLHVHVGSFDYYHETEIANAGLARTATLIDQLRAEAPNSLLLDNGDFLQGSPMGDYIAHARGLKEGDLHPILAAMNLLGYDAAALGNHEFNYGVPFLDRALARAGFPVLSANAVTRRGSDPRRDTRSFAPYALLDRILTDGSGRPHRLRIGVIGLLPPQITTWDRCLLRGRIETRCMIETARALLPELREAGADLIVALAHSGISGQPAEDGMENAALPLARLDGIDALITGHSHLVFPSPLFEGIAGVDAVAGRLAGKPAVMPGFWGSHLGVIDLLLTPADRGWRVAAHASSVRPVARRDQSGTLRPLVPASDRVLDSVGRIHTETLDFMRRKVGVTKSPLHSYFALVAQSESVQLVCRAQEWHLRPLLEGTPHAGLPILSAAAPFKAGGRAGPDHYTSVPAGGLQWRNLADLYSFPNTICAVRITGKLLRDWLERSAAIFRQIRPGATDQPLIDPEFPSYNFDTITGITYEIDLSRAPRFDPLGRPLDRRAGRIRRLRHLGRPVDPDAEFIVATNNYRVNICDDLAGPGRSRVIHEAPITNRDILMRYIAARDEMPGGPVTVSDPCPASVNWRFTPIRDTTALFETSPRACAHLADLPTHLRLEPAGMTEGGFAQYRLHL
ncbi:bifunctional 2',3'-cyclic-nucleotide 2'-phosphodiesterase/3'-nucleotidase [Szabonella alba]